MEESQSGLLPAQTFEGLDCYEVASCCHISPSFAFAHRVIAHSDKNRMTPHNLGIVFGPTLFRPEQETSDPAAHALYPGQLVQLMLTNFTSLFP